MIDYLQLIDRLDGLCPLVGAGEDRAHAERVIAACRDLARRARQDDRLLTRDEDTQLARELMRSTELLGRRSTRALPFATLGRAALADLGGDLASCRRCITECERQLALLGH